MLTLWNVFATVWNGAVFVMRFGLGLHQWPPDPACPVCKGAGDPMDQYGCIECQQNLNPM